jgi:hypothetical protein
LGVWNWSSPIDCEQRAICSRCASMSVMMDMCVRSSSGACQDVIAEERKHALSGTHLNYD